MKISHANTRSNLQPGRTQHGLALLVALLVLVALSLAGIALIRSVDTASMVAGNIAFRQGTTLAADSGVEAARAFLTTTSSAELQQNNANAGYYATSQDSLDLTGNKTPDTVGDNVNWPGTSDGTATPKCLSEDDAGYTACYIVHRLCDSAGPVNVFTCSTRASVPGNKGKSLGPRQAEIGYNPQGPIWGSGAPPLVYYRVTVRVAGPRNNVGFVQAFLII